MSKLPLVLPSGKDVCVQDIVNVYRDSCKWPIVTGASVKRQGDSWLVKAQSSVRNTHLMEMQTLSQCFLVRREGDTLKSVTCSCETANASVLAEDEVATDIVLMQKLEGDKGFAVTWYQDGLLKKSIKLKDFDVHGPVVMKAPFSGFKLSKNGRSVLYIAEKKQPAPRSFFDVDRKPSKDSQDNKESGNEYNLQESWGEALADVYSTVICALDLDSESIDVIEMEGFSLTSPFWIDDEQVGFVAINEHPLKLGITYCINRESYLCKVKLGEKEPVFLTSRADKKFISSPVVNAVGSHVVYLEAPFGGAHFKASRLMLLDLKSETSRPLSECQYYIDSLPSKCWSGDVFYCHSVSDGKSILHKIGTNGSTESIACPFPSASFASVDEGLAVIISSGINQVPQLFACETSKLSSKPNWTPVTQSFQVNQISYSEKKFESQVQAFLLSPSDIASKSSSCIVAIHGGPHSSFLDSFASVWHRFTNLGFKTLLINYRGGTGMSDSTLNTLPGNIGTNDVADCLSAIDHFVHEKLIDPQELFLWGGSHGGFLVCHLTAQFPDRNWVAMATRNPVTDVAVMSTISDIPDWCWFEALGDDSYFNKTLEPSVLSRMFEVSPMKYISQVKTPTLMMLGNEDLRVPMSQGLKWYQTLKRAGVDTHCHVYPDKHSLDKVPVDSDTFTHTMIWFLRHLKQKRSTSG